MARPLRLFALAQTVAVLAACGGADDGTSGMQSSDRLDGASDAGERATVLSAANTAALEGPWTRIAYEGERFRVSGTKTVRYGLGDAWVVRGVTTRGTCSTRFFGSDPAVGQRKQCEVLTAAPPPSSGIGGSGPATGPVAGDPPPVGTVRYVSGNGSDSAAGTQAAPWRTLARVQTAINSSVLRAGDEVQFERGHRYAGSLALGGTLAGTASAPIVFAAYGTGAAPVIDGMRRLGSWQSLGSGRWRATCADCTGTPALLRLDGQVQRLARWPNEDEADRGYRYFTATNGSTSLTDAAMPAGRNWAGGEVVVRSVAWVLDRLPISSQASGGVLNLDAAASYPLQLGYGYFIQNHPDAIDREGEWAYDAATRSITLQSATNPNARAVEVPLPGSRVTVNGAQNVTLRDLVIEGAGQSGVNASGCSGLTLRRLRIGVVGDAALKVEGCSAVIVQGSIVHDSANNGVNAGRNCPGCRIINTTVENIGMFAGMGGNGDGTYVGVSMGGAAGQPAELRGLIVRNSGYIGVDVPFHATLSGSLIQGFNQTKVDGSGIYLWRGTDVTIVDNTVLEAGGSTAGTPWGSTATHGIYLDDNSERITVARNTVGHVGASGVYLHNTRDVTVTDNLVFNPAEAGLLLADDPLGTYAVERTTVRGNTVVVGGAPMLDVSSNERSTFFDTLGTIDGNRYCNPYAEAFVRAGQNGAPVAAMSFSQWRSTYGRDINSALCGERQAPFTLTGTPGANRVGNGTFDSNLAGWFGWPSDTLDARWETGRMDGGSLRLGFNGPSPQVHFDIGVGEVTRGQTYLLELDAVALTGAPSIDVYLRQAGSPYERLGTAAVVLPGAVRGRHALLLQVERDHPDTLLILELRRAGTAVGIDNVSLRPVTAVSRLLRDVARLETNASPSTRSFVLEAPHATLEGTVLPAGSMVTLQPYRSTVLFRR